MGNRYIVGKIGEVSIGSVLLFDERNNEVTTRKNAVESLLNKIPLPCRQFLKFYDVGESCVESPRDQIDYITSNQEILVRMTQSSEFGGKILLSREFYNFKTKQHICIQAHQVGDPNTSHCAIPKDLKAGDFYTLMVSNQGYKVISDFGTTMEKVVNNMMSYVPPPGFLNTDIPDDEETRSIDKPL